MEEAADMVDRLGVVDISYSGGIDLDKGVDCRLVVGY